MQLIKYIPQNPNLSNPPCLAIPAVRSHLPAAKRTTPLNTPHVHISSPTGPYIIRCSFLNLFVAFSFTELTKIKPTKGEQPSSENVDDGVGAWNVLPAVPLPPD